MRSERHVFLLVLASRSLSESVAYATAAAILHAASSGRDPIGLLATVVAVFGVTLVLTSILRERGTAEQSVALTAFVIGGSAAWGLALPAQPPDALAVVTRIVGFGILGEVYLWRLLGVARGQQRWHEVRGDALFALAVVILAALVPGPIDRDPLPLLALVVAVGGAVALSLARSLEELSLSGGQIEGRPVASAATGTAFALGVLAIAVALVLPTAQALLARAATAVGPVLDGILVAILLPLGYVAAVFVAVAMWLRDALGIHALPQIIPPTSPVDDEELRRRLLEAEQSRPLVFGAVEIVIAAIAVLFAAVLVARLLQERRAVIGEGVSVAREAVEGIGLGATLSGLFPHRAVRPRPPADDGTPATRLRRLYWRLLDLAEREGPGRRGSAETPAEHERRLVHTGERWREASAVVRAFEDLRYGEHEPDAATVDRAAAGLARAEAAR